MEEDIKNIVKFIELSKKKAELEFFQRYFSKPFSQEEFSSLISQLSQIDAFFKGKKLFFVLPYQSTINSTNAEIEKFDPSDFSKQILSKNGSAYDLFVLRGNIVKKNFADRYEIAKILALSLKIDPILSAKITELLFSPDPNLMLDVTEPSTEVVSLLILLRKIGIPFKVSNPSVEEKISLAVFSPLYLGYRNYYFTKEQIDRFNQIEKEIAALMPSIQLKNAEAQIKKFTPEEQNAFEEIQGKYLHLIKEKEELLKKSDSL
jgi:hypothetical protein